MRCDGAVDVIPLVQDHWWDLANMEFRSIFAKRKGRLNVGLQNARPGKKTCK
jgi:hypothetical protein